MKARRFKLTIKIDGKNSEHKVTVTRKKRNSKEGAGEFLEKWLRRILFAYSIYQQHEPAISEFIKHLLQSM